MRKGIFALLPLAAMLAACWSSASPLIPDQEADSPKITGTYSRVSSSGEDNGQATIRKLDGGYFDFSSTSVDGTVVNRKARVDQLNGDWYLVQSQNIASGGLLEKPYYRVLKIGKNTLEEFEPACGDYELLTNGVQASGGECTFSHYESLKGAALKRVDLSTRGDAESLSLQFTYKKK